MCCMGIENIPADIRIDSEGVWYYQDAQMFRKDIWQELYRHLRCDETGRYVIELAGERAFVEAEDTPFVIKSVSLGFADGQKENIVYLNMPDDSWEILDPSSLRVGASNILYGTLAGLGIEARFSRAAYYQIAELIEYDIERKRYFISLNNYHYDIRENSDDISITQ